jgi:putative ABC transport system substrate-binding protein
VKRRTFVISGGALAALFACHAYSQGAGLPQRIGFLSLKSDSSLLGEFQTTMKSLGYVEGRDILIDVRSAEDRVERLPALAAELLVLKPTVIVTQGSPAVTACQKATSAVPIVFASAADPVGQGFVQSLRRPGGNITGVAWNAEASQKIYEVVKAALPATTRIATLVNTQNPAQRTYLADVPIMSTALGFQSILVHATKEAELQSAFEHAVKAKAQAVVVPPLAPFVSLRGRIVDLQNRYRMPTFHTMREMVQAGGVASYHFPMEENFRRAAALVDKILKGGSPAEIPVELPTKYEITVNLKAANALGIAVPQSLLVRANEVIE